MLPFAPIRPDSHTSPNLTRTALQAGAKAWQDAKMRRKQSDEAYRAGGQRVLVSIQVYLDTTVEFVRTLTSSDGGQIDSDLVVNGERRLREAADACLRTIQTWTYDPGVRALKGSEWVARAINESYQAVSYFHAAALCFIFYDQERRSDPAVPDLSFEQITDQAAVWYDAATKLSQSLIDGPVPADGPMSASWARTLGNPFNQPRRTADALSRIATTRALAR